MMLYITDEAFTGGGENNLEEEFEEEVEEVVDDKGENSTEEKFALFVEAIEQ